MPKVKVRLNSPFQPQVAKEGEIENHYGVPFTAEATAEKDGKGNAVLILVTEIDEAEAKVMEEAGRVAIIPAAKAEPAKEPAK